VQRKREIAYLMSGIVHMQYLVVSLRSLREWWQGPVAVYTFPASREIGDRIAADWRLGVEHRPWEPFEIPKRSNIQFLNKIAMMQEKGPEWRMYLDADTTIHGPLDELFIEATATGFAATQFSLWESTGSVIRARLTRLLQFPEIPGDVVQHVMTTAYPSPNGGIFVCRPGSPVLPRWLTWSRIAQSIFIADEAVLHILQVTMRSYVTVVRGGRWNCSHKYQSVIRDPVIYHYHGDSAVRPDKSPRAYAAWWPRWQAAIKDDIGGAADWGPAAVVQNKWMRKLRDAEPNPV